MSNFSNRREREEMQELLKVYQNLKNGRAVSFLDEEDFEKIIDYFDEKDDLTAASEAAELGLQLFPYSSQMMLKKADLLIASRHYDQALSLLDEAQLYDSNDINLYILKTDAYLALEMPEKAAHILENALELFEGDDRIDLLFELADVYDDYEDFDKVFDCLQLILREDPNNEEALLKICFWADFTGRCADSIKLHQWIIDEYPFNEIAWFNLATAYQGIKLYEKAIDAYQYALAIDEKLDIAYRNMADALIKMRRYKEAIENLQKVIELNRPEDVIYEAIGHCYHKIHKYADARFYYRKASHLNPGDSNIFYKIAHTYCNEAKWESAVRQLEAALKVHHLQAEYNLLMGECKMEQGKLKEAIQYFSTVVGVKPKNVAGREALIRCLIKGNFLDEALEQCVHAAAASSENPLFEYYHSAVLFLMSKNKEALLRLEKGLKGNPKAFKKMLDIVPGLLQRPNVVEIINRYMKRKKGK
jgi:tetratricopeptide (TPR) repeat protein